MSESIVLSTKAMALDPGPFGDLLRCPRDLRFGPEETENESISVEGLQVRLGDRPIAKNLRRLYELGHKGLPPDLAVFDAYDIWVITHTIGAIRRTGRATILALGYEVRFEEDQVFTIDLLPQSKFNTIIDGTFGTNVELGAEGHAGLPGVAGILLESFEYLGGDATVKLSSELKVIGHVSFSMISPIVSTVGIGSSRCEWCFHVDRNPLLGEQIMLQTILVPRYTEVVKFKIRGYALIRPKWVSFSARFGTAWLPVECQLI